MGKHEKTKDDEIELNLRVKESKKAKSPNNKSVDTSKRAQKRK